MKNKLFISLITIIGFMTSCGPTNPSDITTNPTTNDSATSEPSESKPSTSNPESDSFEDAYTPLRGDNIAFKIIHELKQVEDLTNNVTITNNGHRIASYEDGKFSFQAFKEEEKLLEYTFYANDNGVAVQSYVDLNNNLITTPLTNSLGETFDFRNESIYVNFFSFIDAKFFPQIDDTTYGVSKNTAEPLLISDLTYFCLALSGMSHFDVDKFAFEFVDGQISKIVAKDEEKKDSVNQPYTMQNVLTITPIQIGDVEIKIAEKFPHQSENESAQTVIESLEKSNKFVSEMKYYPISIELGDDNIYHASKAETPSRIDTTYFDSEDIVTYSVENGITTLSGFHSHDNGYGSFIGSYNDDNLNINELEFTNSNESQLYIDQYYPTFDFNLDIFEYQKTDEKYGQRFYLRDNDLSYVLGELYFEDFTSINLGIYPIAANYKDSILTFTFDIDYNSTRYFVELSYTKINEDVMDKSIFNSEIYHEYVPVTSYKDERLFFEFEDVLEGPYNGKTLTFDEFFTLGLGENYNVPFYEDFAPNFDSYLGGISMPSSGEEPTYAELAIKLSNINGLGLFANELSIGYEMMADPTGNYDRLYKKGDLTIGLIILPEYDFYSIGFMVPIKNFLAK